MNTADETRNVGIYVFDEVEVLDFTGPFEVFSTASRVSRRLRPEQSVPFTVSLVGDAVRVVRARGGLNVKTDTSIAHHPRLDVLIVPGGEVTQELTKTAVLSWIADTAPSTEITASVCTGAFLLAKARLLDGRRVTTHWEDLDDLERDHPLLRVERSQPFIDEGSIVTSAGIAAGIDMSLHLVSRLAGEELAVRTARQMDYPWRHGSLAR